MKRFRFSLSRRECGDDCNPLSYYLHWQCVNKDFQTFHMEASVDDEEQISELWPKAYQIEVIEKQQI